ncbi:hypothetical protein [Streptomyces sp. SID12501]|nr:hypothetical protein [Streptomyces sp. SID12501]
MSVDEVETWLEGRQLLGWAVDGISADWGRYEAGVHAGSAADV